MKSPRHILFAFALGCALFSAGLHAAPARVENQVARLDALVGLSAEQKGRVAEIFSQQAAALAAFGPNGDVDERFKTMEGLRTELRAALTPAQQKIYDRTPQVSGGGANLMQPDNEVARLDALVALSPEQKVVARQVFEEEFEALVMFAPGDERATKGEDVRQKTKDEVRALLTAEQRTKYDTTPLVQGGGLPVNPDNMTASLDRVVSLTAAQKTAATQIFWDEARAQVAAATPDRPLRGFRWNAGLRDRLRALLTPEQQAKFDATPPYRQSGPR